MLLKKILIYAAASLFASLSQSNTVIVNANNTADGLSQNVIRSIFSMRMREWKDGTPIKVFVLEDKSPIHRQFVQKALAMQPHQLRRDWNRNFYTGVGLQPIQVSNEQEMIRKIISTRGAIGYASSSSISKALSNGAIRQLTAK